MSELTEKEKRKILKALGKYCQGGSEVITAVALSDMVGISADKLFQYGLENPNIFRPETRENSPCVYFFINVKAIPQLITNAQWTHSHDEEPRDGLTINFHDIDPCGRPCIYQSTYRKGFWAWEYGGWWQYAAAPKIHSETTAGTQDKTTRGKG